MTDPTDPTCEECRAPRVGGLTCWVQFGVVLSWEADDPELLAERFPTVATYNLQHPAQFTGDALCGLREAFIDRLDRGVTIAEIRRRMARASAGATRVPRPEAERRPVPRAWRLTVADVYVPDRPRGAAERVRRWAAAVRPEP